MDAANFALVLFANVGAEVLVNTVKLAVTNWPLIVGLWYVSAVVEYFSRIDNFTVGT